MSRKSHHAVQHIKLKFHPPNLFTHSLSVPPPGAGNVSRLSHDPTSHRSHAQSPAGRRGENMPAVAADQPACRLNPRGIVMNSNPLDGQLQAKTKRRHYPTIYDEMLKPLSPSTVLPVQTRIIKDRHVSKVKQLAFLKLVEQDGKGLEEFLAENKSSIAINQYGDDGLTPLQRVCQQGGSVRTAKLLLRHGADPRLTSRDGWSPVHLASFSGNTSLIMFLVDA